MWSGRVWFVTTRAFQQKAMPFGHPMELVLHVHIGLLAHPFYDRGLGWLLSVPSLVVCKPGVNYEHVIVLTLPCILVFACAKSSCVSSRRWRISVKHDRFTESPQVNSQRNCRSILTLLYCAACKNLLSEHIRPGSRTGSCDVSRYPSGHWHR